MASDAVERESMEVDVLIIGGGPSGLSAAIRVMQLAQEKGEELSVIVLEKGGEIGAHILSGVVVDPIGLDTLIPDWRTRDDRPLKTEVTDDKFIYLGPKGSLDISLLPMPGFMKNHGNFTGSLGNVTRFLAQEAENMGVEIFPGFAASELVYGENDEVRGVIAGVAGLDAEGNPKADYEPGMELLGKYVLFAEGTRGSLSKKLIAKFNLDEGCEPQKYGIGLKELWSVPEENFKEGYVQHTLGWPLANNVGGGSFLYHFRDNGEPFISLGFVVHLNYENPYIAPYQEFQRWKHHPEVVKFLEGGKRVSYGARAITEGGWQSVPKLAFPGGALIGCSAGFVNVPRIKGSHNAILTGMMGAEAAFNAIQAGRSGDELVEYEAAYEGSSVYKELKTVRNVKPLLSRFGTILGTAFGGVEMWLNTLIGWSPLGTMSHAKTDAASLKPASKFKPIDYPKPDGKISFDKLTNVSFTNTYHGEDQPCHLRLLDPELQKTSELGVFDGPSARYCPAGVYEWVEEANGEKSFQINSQNCIHCKTCDIKDPNQNINWETPEGGGGPAYPNM
ncbi:MAG: electron transfer flavoprotein-ubiquinone oxidoreductase [Ponticaulis sp.]|nr:electron transfer flavoprotein-ubiquinone oxidoreductase [Ponticaulis sp.]